MTVENEYPGDDDFQKDVDPYDKLLNQINGELDPEIIRERQMRDQEIEEVRDFSKAIGAYWEEQMKANVPPPIAGALVREFQQAELQRRLNMEVLHERLQNE